MRIFDGRDMKTLIILKKTSGILVLTIAFVGSVWLQMRNIVNAIEGELARDLGKLKLVLISALNEAPVRKANDHRINEVKAMPVKYVSFSISAVTSLAGLLALLGMGAMAQPIALVGGQLVDGYEATPIHDSIVLIEGDTITAAGPAHAITVPEDAHVIDTRGRTVMPGLIDLHVHMEIIGHGDYGVYQDFIGDDRDKLRLVREIAAKQSLRAGVTTVVDMGSTFEILETRERVAAGEIPGPRVVASGPWISRLHLPEILPEDAQLVISSPQEAAARTVELIERGVDVIKAWVGLTRADYAAIVREAHARGVKVHAHLYEPEQIRKAIDAGVDVLQHMGSAKNPAYDHDLVMEIAHKDLPVVQTIAHRIWVYPATVAFPTRLEDPLLREDLPPDWYAEFQRSFEQFHRLDYFREVEREMRLARVACRQFIEADAVNGVGTDAGSPMNFHSEAMWREMSALVDCGMSPAQAITAATKTNAEILSDMALLGGARRFGTIEPGMLADIIVVEGDPRFDIEALNDVVLTIKEGMPWFTARNATATLQEIGQQF